MSKKRYLEAEMLKEFLRMGMKVGHIHTLRDVENYIDTQPEATPQEVAGQCWRNFCSQKDRNRSTASLRWSKRQKTSASVTAGVRICFRSEKSVWNERRALI